MRLGGWLLLSPAYFETQGGNEHEKEVNGRSDQPKNRDREERPPHACDHGPSSRLVKMDFPPLRARK